MGFTCLLIGPKLSLAQTAFYENEPIRYSKTPVDDDVTKLLKRLESGEVKLTYEKSRGYLRSLLKELQIPESSQTLVFSKTSLQIQKITPLRPRALYFNDDVYVGFVQRGDVIELGATDSRQGPTFYSLKQDPTKPLIQRDQGQCIVCHASGRTQSVPGFLIRSVFPSRSGHPNYGSGTYNNDHTSPFRERWGGWYVTGKHGDMHHMGNQTFRVNNRGDLSKGANIESLEELVSTKPYLNPHSDIVALMVLQHQVQMHNAITFANFDTRQALHQAKSMNRILERPETFKSESTKRRIRSAAERVVSHLLMCDEFKLTSKVTGTSGFAEEFAQRGPFDQKQRSLRQFDLNTRLFRYPCSYLIYSPSFDGLPDEVRLPILDLLIEVLQKNPENADSETDTPVTKTDDDNYQHLTRDDRQAIMTILRETKPEFAERLQVQEAPSRPIENQK